MVVVFADALLASAARRRNELRQLRDEASALIGASFETASASTQRIAEDLRVLGLARRTAIAGSARHIAATRAYDRRLRHACQVLDLEEHLGTLKGIDLELERLRAEGMLLSFGIELDHIRAEQDIDGHQEHC